MAYKKKLMIHLYKFETYVNFNWAQNNEIAINFSHLNKIYNNLRKVEDYNVGKKFDLF